MSGPPLQATSYALEAAWQAALAEAWEAYLQGSYPIGACVADAEGNVLARGRNRLGEERRVDGIISGHRLGHAEVNALLTLPDLPKDDYNNLTLYSTVEPCPMCLGAILMAQIGHFAYAAADLWAGHSEALTKTFYPSQRGVKVSRSPAELVRACTVWQFTFHLDRGLPLDHGFFQIHRQHEPELYAAAEHLHATGALLALKERRASLAEALELLMGPTPTRPA
ncbi:tRNA-specific adenosine deaminase [Deinococcus xinjiangensis]|uniref:tRNA-specific adenosine deaminase n=1 Tax=Deinococcus xinjiangensis TaxID=457454 RepID=A0ABP9VI38_9DEIO